MIDLMAKVRFILNPCKFCGKMCIFALSFQPAFERVWKLMLIIGVVRNSRFQKPAFEWVWKLLRASRLFSSGWFQKPAFEWVWELKRYLSE